MPLSVYRCVKNECGSAAMFDWGIELLEETQKFPSIKADNKGKQEELDDWAGKVNRHHVKVCAACFTPYIIEAGKLVDVSEEIDEETLRGLFLNRIPAMHKPPKGAALTGSGARKD